MASVDGTKLRQMKGCIFKSKNQIVLQTAFTSNLGIKSIHTNVVPLHINLARFQVVIRECHFNRKAFQLKCRKFLDSTKVTRPRPTTHPTLALE